MVYLPIDKVVEADELEFANTPCVKSWHFMSLIGRVDGKDVRLAGASLHCRNREVMHYPDAHIGIMLRWRGP